MTEEYCSALPRSSQLCGVVLEIGQVVSRTLRHPEIGNATLQTAGEMQPTGGSPHGQCLARLAGSELSPGRG